MIIEFIMKRDESVRVRGVKWVNVTKVDIHAPDIANTTPEALLR